MKRTAPTFGTFVDQEYWPAVAPGLSPGWRDRTRGILDVLVAEFGTRSVTRLEPRDVAAWWGRALASWSPRTANMHLVRLRQVYKVAASWYGAQDPTRGIARAREPRARVQFFTGTQREALLAHAGPMLYPYVLWGLYTGARRRSLMRLQWEDVNGDTVTFRDTKTGEDHVVPLHPALRAWVGGQPSRVTGPALPQYQDPRALSRAFKRLATRLGLPAWARLHSLRHDVGSRLGAAGVNQTAIMEVLGHKDPRMSARYTHLDQAAVRRVIENAL